MQGFSTACDSPAIAVRRRLCVIALAVFAAISLAACDVWISNDTRVQRAQEHMAKGQYRPAMAELKTALQKEPDHMQARIALAELSLWLGDMESAEKEIDRARAAGASDVQLALLQYELLLAQQRFDEVGSLLAADSVTPAVRRRVIAARAASGRGDAAQAEEELKHALESAPDDPEALLESARLAAARGQVEPALSLPERLTEADDIRARALYLRGVVLMNQGEHSKAREALARAQESGPKLRVTEQMAIAAARTEVSLALNDVEDADKSVAKLATWVKDSLVVHYLRARIAMQKNDFVSAVAECQRALRIDPGHVQSQILLAAAHLAQGSTEQAEDVLTRLLTANPTSLAARKLLGQVYLARNQPGEARSVLDAAAIGGQGDSDMDWLMGAALMKSGSTTVALQHLERSVAAEPKDMSRRIDLAGAYIAARLPGKAAELLVDVPSDSPQAPRARVLQVLAAAAGKSRADARREIESLVASRPDDAALSSVAGAYLAAAGERVRGRELLERAIALDPKGVDARMALARLDVGERKLSEANRRLLEVIKLAPAHQPARLALAELAWGAGDRSRSRKWLEDAVSVNPAAIEARLHLAQIAFVEGDAARARNLLDQALSVAGDRKTVLTSIGRVLARAGLSDEALARFREASAAGDANAILEAARLHLELDQPKNARELIEPALASRPQWREAEQMLVMIDARDGQATRAIERAKKLAGDASPAALRTLEGDLYAIAGDAEAAVSAYTAAQKLQPSGMLAIKLFQVMRGMDAPAAERSLTQWLAQAPEDSDVRRVLVSHYESSGQADRALGEYERLLSADRIDAPMLNNFAWLLHERGDPRALDLARRAYSAAPQYAEIGDTYGWLLVQMDKVAEGLAVLEKALAGAPGNPDIQYHAAVACAKSGQKARAVQLLRDALQTPDRFSSRSDAEQLARTLSMESSH